VSLELVAAGIAIAGAVVAVSSSQGRVAVLGLVLVLVAAPLIASPTPDLLPLGGRLVAAILVGYLLWVALRSEPSSVLTGSRLGWPVEGLAAAAAALAGVGMAHIGGMAEAQGAGFALIVLAIAPIASHTNLLRMAVGLTLLVTAAGLLRVAAVGPPSAFEQIVTSWLVVALGGAMAYLVATSGEPAEDGPPAGPRPAQPRT
jgi:hypothetical protein